MSESDVKLIALDAWFKVSRNQFDEIRDFVGGAVKMLADIKYTAAFKVQFLYGEFWDDYSHYQRRLIGRCVAYIVKNRMLELERAGSPRTNPKCYLVKITN